MNPVYSDNSLQWHSLLHFSHYYGFTYRTHMQTDIQAETHANIYLSKDLTCFWRKIKIKSVHVAKDRMANL